MFGLQIYDCPDPSIIWENALYAYTSLYQGDMVIPGNQPLPKYNMLYTHTNLQFQTSINWNTDTNTMVTTQLKVSNCDPMQREKGRKMIQTCYCGTIILSDSHSINQQPFWHDYAYVSLVTAV